MTSAERPLRGVGRRRRYKLMGEINVTPFVDVMLVLLIVFMITAPLLTVGVPIDLPQTQAKSLDQNREPLTVSVNLKGQVFLQNSEIKVEELVGDRPFDNLDDYITQDELRALSDNYKTIAGFAAPGTTAAPKR